MEINRYAPPRSLPDAAGDEEVARRWSSLETRTTTWVRRVAAIALASAFFLPLSSCAGVDHAASGYYTPLSLAWFVVVIGFFWPIAYELACSLSRRLARAAASPWPRLLLSGGSLVVVSGLCFYSDRLRYGAFVAYAGIACYAGALVALLRRDCRRRDLTRSR